MSAFPKFTLRALLRTLHTGLLFLTVSTALSQGPSPAPSSPSIGLTSPLSREERRRTKVAEEYLQATEGMQIATLPADSLKSQLGDTNLVLVDVRQPNEQIVSMLPGALTTYEFSQKFKTGFPASKRVVVYCTIGHRSGEYAEELQTKNVPVQNLEGGIIGWTHVGGKLVRDSAGVLVPTQKVHVYSEDMQKWIALDYVPVWGVIPATPGLPKASKDTSSNRVISDRVPTRIGGPQ
jgi:rhodanese-related sulfurtransferase